VAEPGSRRDRIRAATVQEIKDTARGILVTDGPPAITLRAIAREMGMSAPALYRYFESREELLLDLINDLYEEITDVMTAARDAHPEDAAPERLMAVSRAFRGWAVGHRPEFGLVFGSPVGGSVGACPPLPPEPEDTRLSEDQDDPGLKFGGIFAGLTAQIYLTKPFPIPADDEIDPGLRKQLATFMRKLPVPLPDGVGQVFLSCWIRLYGVVSMEVFGHLGFALDDVEPMFEVELKGLAEQLDLADAYRPPATLANR
jgi:AcrR family transcriptional regulator